MSSSSPYVWLRRSQIAVASSTESALYLPSKQPMITSCGRELREAPKRSRKYINYAEGGMFTLLGELLL